MELGNTMASDPYAALGLTKTATAAEIKKAYRKLVRSSHPDLHPDDPKAEARFKLVNAAYDLLADPEKRARFDAGEIDDAGAERPPRNFYRDYAETADHPYQPRRGFQGFGDPADIFAEILRQRGGGATSQGSGFGDRFAATGQDFRFALDVPFLDAACGTKTRLTLPDSRELEVQIPKGLQDGQTLRLRGEGGPGMGGGPAGDALITVRVLAHPVFRSEGDDILMTLPISIDEAVLGGKVTAPTIAGPVSLSIPAGANSGQTLRLRGRGIERVTGKPGDQRIELRIFMPPKVDLDLRSFVENWRKTHAYDPRKDLFKGVPE
jgi:DnaJ-class molecular chaperone